MARIRVNVLCLIGIAIAVISMTGLWTEFPPIPPLLDIQVYHFPEHVPQLFIIGTLIALLTPLGGIVQFISAIESILLWMSPAYQYDPHLTVMPFIGAVSSIIVLYSIRLPQWIYLDRGEIPGREISTRLMRSLLTFSVELDRKAKNPD